MYQDLMGLQFCFISFCDSVNNSKKETKTNKFHRFSQPIVDALTQLGLEVEFSGRNDLLLKGKKFSGNSQYSISNRFLHHGTILFDTDLEILVRSLNPSDEKIISKGIKSVRERVINIRSYLNNPEMSFEEFKQNIVDIVGHQMQTISFSEKQITEIEALEKTKYLS